jgi:DNA repair protein RadD
VTLRPYQLRAIESLRRAYRDGCRAPLLVLPTGAGKTRTAVEVVRSHLERVTAGHVLWVAHRRELVGQAISALNDAGVHEAGLPAQSVSVRSVQSLLEDDTGLETPTMVVLDECHHYVAAQWRTVATRYPDAIRIGLTATPERGDGTAMGDMFGRLIVGATVAELTELGHLVPCHIVGPRTRQRRAVAGGGPVEAYQRWVPGQRTVVYCATVEHAEQTGAEFAAAGIDVAVIEGGTHERDRDRALARFAAGELRVLINVYVLTEGWDCPATEAIILARGFGHASTYLQAIGRGLRPAPGKTHCTVVDLCGSWLQHGRPEDPREYSLEGRAMRTVKALPPLRQCQQCGAVYRAGPTECVRCGFRLPTFVPQKSTQELQAIAQRETPDQRDSYLARLTAAARARGHRPGWIAHMYHAKYGQWPRR